MENIDVQISINFILIILGEKRHYRGEIWNAVEQEITILFSDIRHYTTLSENMTPEDTFQFVNAFNKRMKPIILLNNGFVNQYLGDAIRALFKIFPLNTLMTMLQKPSLKNKEAFPYLN